MTGSDSGRTIDRLIAIMARLRDPESGCPWDREQSFATIAPYTVEEAYEVLDAIERRDMPGLREELGDLLFQVVFHARMAEEAGAFSFDDVVREIIDKMVRRHPHIFGAADVRSAEAQSAAWEEQKAVERRAKASGRDQAPSALDGVPATLPAMTRGLKLQRRAAREGFDWTDADAVLAKVEEEIAELREALRETADGESAAGKPAPAERLREEMGDLLFACVNLARHLKVDPEQALRESNSKFERRFRHVEARLVEQGRSTATATLDEMEALWSEAKRREKPDDRR